jgi:hypothetical protein
MTESPSDARLRAMAAVLLRASAEGPIGMVEQLVRATRGLDRADRRRLQAVLDDGLAPKSTNTGATQ